MKASRNKEYSLNAICPYFTMFPLEFPLNILRKYSKPGDVILDPFCGRGTTNYAAWTLGLDSIGIDSNPVAVAITEAKLCNASPESIVREAEKILSSSKKPFEIPKGRFWDLAYEKSTLEKICIIKDALINKPESQARKALRGIMLGALHGPRNKHVQSYFSNQAPRTYSPKPDYAVRFWERNHLYPQKCDVISIISMRAHHYFKKSNAIKVKGRCIHGDSRDLKTFKQISENTQPKWIITSPPYFRMKTYTSDHWIRLWFLGISSHVDYSSKDHFTHSTIESFCTDLHRVCTIVADISHPSARLIIRFGSIPSNPVDPFYTIKSALCNTPWRVYKTVNAGTAGEGRRQADSFIDGVSCPLVEYDFWCKLKQ